MDVISMAENDVKLAVASMGTTLSQTQILKMWNFSSIPTYALMVMRQEENRQKLLLLKY